ncbi:MAG: enoyl-CoA hydratase-related protein [Caulobacteraceae bacterium]|nr:enoyl-CoA hydratase-related protein [Caulobacteraceae bacterium]
MTSYADGALLLSIDGAVATITLNRPAQRNALNAAMWRALPEAAAKVANNPSIRVLVMRGAGGHFASGADIAEFPVLFASRETTLAYEQGLEDATAAIAGLGKPVIALIEGYCIGAGLAVALACDLRLAADDAQLGAPPAKLGLMYNLVDTRRLIDAVGAAAAKDILFTGALQPAARAMQIGLVNEIHAPQALEAAVRAKALTIAGLSSWTMGKTKTVVELILHGQADDDATTRGWFADAVEGPDFAEGLAAFLEKRKPSFP